MSPPSAAQYGVYLRRGGKRRLRTRSRRREGARGARAAQRLDAVATLEQRDDEARGEGVSGRGPVDDRDRGRRRARDLAAALEERRALRAVGDRDELAVRDDLVLEAVDDQQVGLHVDRPRGRGVEREERRAARRGEHHLVRHLELAENGALDLARGEPGVRTRDDDDLVLTVRVDEDQRDTRRLVT